MTASECLKHSWLQPHPHLKENSAESESESELEIVEDSLLDLPDLQKDEETSSSISVTPDSMIMSSMDSSRPSSSYLSAKRPSLDMSKDNLKEFVTRYSDNPYVFDTRGIITHVAGETPKCKVHSKSTSLKPPSDDDARGINLVNQIRRFSKQLNEEIEIMKKQCHDCNNVNTLRKCDVSVNAH